MDVARSLAFDRETPIFAPPRRRLLIPLRLSIAIAFVLLVLATTTSLGLAAGANLKSVVREESTRRLHELMNVAVLTLDGDAHARIRTDADRRGPDYARIRAQLNAIKRASPDIRYVYTMRRVGDQVVFVSGADAEIEQEVGFVYAEATAEQRTFFDPPFMTRVAPDFVMDRWGTWLTGSAPIRTRDGRVDALLGIDIEARRIESTQRDHGNLVFLVFGIVGLFAIVSGVIFSDRISRALMRVEDELARVRRFDLDQPFRVRSNVKEVVSIADAVIGLKKGLRSFKKYVPPELVADIVANNREAALGAVKRELSVFFIDIAGFTGISERLPPSEVVALLERYLTGICREVRAEGGTIDKFIGDAVMAFWGAPRECDDQATRACMAALGCARFLRESAAMLEARGLPPLAARIGVHTGEAVVGNIGFEERFSYTAIGDQVNLTSRLEGINKAFGTTLLVSAETIARTNGAFATRYLGEIVVKGRKAPVGVYELLGRAGELPTRDRRFVERFEAALALYRERELERAKAMFEECLAERPEDRASELYLERCNEKPGPDWSPAIVMTEK